VDHRGHVKLWGKIQASVVAKTAPVFLLGLKYQHLIWMANNIEVYYAKLVEWLHPVPNTGFKSTYSMKKIKSNKHYREGPIKNDPIWYLKDLLNVQ